MCPDERPGLGSGSVPENLQRGVAGLSARFDRERSELVRPQYLPPGLASNTSSNVASSACLAALLLISSYERMKSLSNEGVG